MFDFNIESSVLHKDSIHNYSFCMKASRARALFKAGLRTPQAVAEVTVSELAKALFESSSWGSQG